MGNVFQMALGRKECTTYTFRCSYELPFDPKGGAGKASKRKSVPMTAARLQKLASNLFLYTGDAARWGVVVSGQWRGRWRHRRIVWRRDDRNDDVHGRRRRYDDGGHVGREAWGCAQGETVGVERFLGVLKRKGQSKACDAVGKAVASDFRGTQFECHLILGQYCSLLLPKCSPSFWFSK